MQTTQILFKYEELIRIWKSFCELHQVLFDLTCDEYLILLESDIDRLEPLLAKKDAVINKIGEIETKRKLFVEEVNSKKLFENNISNLSQLIRSFERYENGNNKGRLEKLNLLLIDIIEKIQKQNKKNQIFLNRAILSLQEMRESFMGEKKYKTYGSNGLAQKGTNR